MGRDDHVTPQLLESLLQQTGFQYERSRSKPSIPLSQSALLTNAQDEYLIGSELAKEICWADRIDCLCAFIKWSGLQQVLAPLRTFRKRGGRLRVITTTYMQATDQRALDKLVELGAHIKVCYDTELTRLHAKAWLFHRDTKFTTAYIGSSNLSGAALMHGLEWNVRVSNVDARPIVEKFEAAFGSYWEDSRFVPYDRKTFAEVIGPPPKRDRSSFLELHPYDFQEEILQRLETERFVHGRMRNLVVAATGTGKTVMAALDYRRLRARPEHGGDLSLLYVAHRRQILDQSRETFRHALRDRAFGELYASGLRPEQGTHVFASVQSLARIDLTTVDPKRFDVVIVDEFHHAAAQTYDRLLKYLCPQYLLGLTATPERADEKDVLHWFDGRIAAELRLWDAISIRRLVPFKYYGVADGTDLAKVQWRRGQYDGLELTNLYTADHVRVRKILEALESRVLDPKSMCAIGFCVSVRHARFMADRFSRYGIPAKAITGDTSIDDRRAAISALAQRKVNVLFTVDVLTEGVDIPEVDTILLLRPTSSATVFMQQIGRGLRKHPGKDTLVILDFIGQSRREYRFDFKFGRLLGGVSRGAVKKALEDRFPPMPSGCVIELDEESRDIVLNNLKQWVSRSVRAREAMQRLGPQATLSVFLDDSGMTVEEFYKRGYLTRLRRQSTDYNLPDAGPDEERLGKRLRLLLHVDEPQRLEFYREVVQRKPDRPFREGQREKRLLIMLLCTLLSRSVTTDLEGSYNKLLANPAICQEIVELMDYLKDQIRHVPKKWNDSPDVPLAVHCRYSLHEIMAAFKIVNKSGSLIQLRSGVHFDKKTQYNLLFVTIDKSEKDYSPATMYKDYAVSPELFHWQSQYKTKAESLPGRRHTDHKNLGITPLLFVRYRKKNEHGMTEPYMFLGPVEYVTHEGEKPMSITWRLKTLIPADFLRVVRMAA